MRAQIMRAQFLSGLIAIAGLAAAPGPPLLSAAAGDRLAQGGAALPVDRLEVPAAGAEGTTLRPIDAGHAELCRPDAQGGAPECMVVDFYDEVFTIRPVEVPSGGSDVRLSFHGHTGAPRGFLVLGRAPDDAIRLAAEFWPAEGRTYLRDGRWDRATGGRPPILWVAYGTSCGENCGYAHWAPFTVIDEGGRPRLAPAGPVSTPGVHSSGYEGGVLTCTQFQGGPEPRANDDGSFTVFEVSRAEGQMVEQTWTWSTESGALVVSQTGAPQPAPIEGDCPHE